MNEPSYSPDPFLLSEEDLALPTYLNDQELRKIAYAGSSGDKGDAEALVQKLCVYAVSARASDIHLDCFDRAGDDYLVVNVREPNGMKQYDPARGTIKGSKVKERIFGLTNTASGASAAQAISTRFSMRFPLSFAQLNGLTPFAGENYYYIDVRVQIIETFDGTGITCRLLDPQRAPALDDLKLSLSVLTALKHVAQESSGLVLVSGPTGSGKTTLLNAVITWLINGQRSIVTIENPVEFRLRGKGPLKQIQVSGSLTFAHGLRAAMRLDPDVILIGEIRDQETMEIALQAAQTGHMVFATIHSNSGCETIARAIDLTQDKERDATRLAEVLKGVIAQRLIPAYEPMNTERSLDAHESNWLRTNGIYMNEPALSTNADTGTRAGKQAVVEALFIDQSIREIIRSGHYSVDSVYARAVEQLQYESLAMAGVRAVQSKVALLADCRHSLDSYSCAGSVHGLRFNLAKKFNVDFSQVGNLIDAYQLAVNSNEEPMSENWQNELFAFAEKTLLLERSS